MCKTHDVVLEEVEWTITGHGESSFRGHESTCKDLESALLRPDDVTKGSESAVESIKVTVEAVSVQVEIVSVIRGW